MCHVRYQVGSNDICCVNKQTVRIHNYLVSLKVGGVPHVCVYMISDALPLASSCICSIAYG